jgi:hypothetical protein
VVVLGVTLTEVVSHTVNFGHENTPRYPANLEMRGFSQCAPGGTRTRISIPRMPWSALKLAGQRHLCESCGVGETTVVVVRLQSKCSHGVVPPWPGIAGPDSRHPRRPSERNPKEFSTAPAHQMDRNRGAGHGNVDGSRGDRSSPVGRYGHAFDRLSSGR